MFNVVVILSIALQIFGVLNAYLCSDYSSLFTYSISVIGWVLLLKHRIDAMPGDINV